MNVVSILHDLYLFFSGVLSSLSSGLPDPVWQKMLVIAVLTWGWEEPISLGAALMVASGDLGFWPAFGALAVGFPTGDSLLYLIGRFGKPLVARTRWYRESRAMRMAERWFREESFGTLFLTRFTPGFRFPTYVAAGIFHLPYRRFLSVVAVAGLVETTALLLLAKLFGETVLDSFVEHKKLIGGCLFTAMLVFVSLSAILRYRKFRRELAAGGEGLNPEDAAPTDVWRKTKTGHALSFLWDKVQEHRPPRAHE
jgi:membrane protein DedA with SNARE-associated domain